MSDKTEELSEMERLGVYIRNCHERYPDRRCQKAEGVECPWLHVTARQTIEENGQTLDAGATEFCTRDNPIVIGASRFQGVLTGIKE